MACNEASKNQEPPLNIKEYQDLKDLMQSHFQDFAETYIESMDDYVKNIETGMANNNLAMVADNAHPIRSVSASLGAHELSELAKTLENETLKLIEEADNQKRKIKPMVEEMSAKYAALRDFIGKDLHINQEEV